MLGTMFAASAECPSMAVLQMASTQGTTVLLSGESADMRSTCSVSQNGSQRRQSNDARFADDLGSLSLQQLIQLLNLPTDYGYYMQRLTSASISTNA